MQQYNQIRCNASPCNTMQYVTEHDNKEQQETIQWNTIQADDTKHYTSIGYNVNQYMTVQRNRIHQTLDDSIQCNTIEAMR